jgi:2-oxo-4-hydroxy-4-carboxy-5-ureidoimidazoline decarboxylase
VTQPTLDALNGSDRDAFVAAIGWVFEHSPWVAERTWEQRPFPSLDRLHSAMAATVAGASRAEQRQLLCAHPDLGSRARMTDASQGEQAGAGLDRLSREHFDQLQRLTAAYRAKFGFPFLLAVKGCTIADVLSGLESRLPRGEDDEFAEAIRQACRIARFRLEGALSDHSSG